MAVDVVSVLERLERWGAERRWIGPDPYEGLSTFAGRIARSRRSRQAVVQLYRRLPLPPPWPLRARPTPNSKALALALAGYATPAGRRLPGADEFLSTLPGELRRLNLVGAGAAWGYPFDAQTRHLFFGQTTPNAVATCFVAGALLDASDAIGDPALAGFALAARPFLLSLRHEAPGHGPFFAYVSGGSELIHNANLLVCGALARLHAVEPDEEAETRTIAAVETTLRAQGEDGLWPYGEASNLRWADNFHTAYVLEGLHRVRSTFGVGGEELERGLVAWRDRFFEPHGWVRYYADRRFPLDAHCCASAIDLLCLLAADPSRAEAGELAGQANRVAEVAIRELWLPESGRFGYRRVPRGINRREFMRWTNAPMFRALARLASDRHSPGGRPSSERSAVPPESGFEAPTR